MRREQHGSEQPPSLEDSPQTRAFVFLLQQKQCWQHPGGSPQHPTAFVASPNHLLLKELG